MRLKIKNETKQKATDMSVSLSAERDRIQRQVEELEQSLSATQTELELLSSETDDESDVDEEEGGTAGQAAAGLLAQREKIQKEIQNLENILGPHSPTCVSDDSSSDESELGLSPSVDSCLQMNLVYQQVIQETLNQLETLLTHNLRQQKEVVSQLSGPIKGLSNDQRPTSSCQQPTNMYLGRFLKPYFKDRVTGLGPPSNQEAKEKSSRMAGCLDDKALKLKRWECWQKTLLIHSVTRDSLRRLTQPKLSRMDYLTQKLSTAEEAHRQQLREQIDSLEREIDLLKEKKEEELIGDRYEEHDWQKISNIDFEGTKDAEDIRSFWQNFLHPSIKKIRWSQEEVQELKEISQRHNERHWDTIARELGTGRTAFMCLQTFQRFVSGSLKRGGWTRAEDELLRELVDKMRIGNFIPYTQMSYFMEGRDPTQLVYRWNHVLDPSLKKGPWTQHEDQLLLQAVSRHGEKDWWKIRFEVPGRSDTACRDRYYDSLKADTKRGPFDQQEQELLVELVEKHGVGRWAKIAAEIPHRNDAQCLREWRKLSRPARPQRDKKATKRIRRQLMTLKEEEEEEEMIVEYMDSDQEEEKTKEVVEENTIEELGKEKELEKEEEKEYIIPPMQEWIPADKAQSFTSLSFQPVELPSSGDTCQGGPVRSTILGQFGSSVIIGPQPRLMPWERRHSSSTMMMVSPEQLQAHLSLQARKFNNQSSCSRGKTQTSKQNQLGRVTDMGLGYELQAAVTPWIGNLLIPAKTRQIVADVVREQNEKTHFSSTPVFLLLLQTMNVDSVGCKETIELRRKRVVSLTSPANPSSAHRKPSKTIAQVLKQKEENLFLNQLQMLQQVEKHNLHPPRLPSVTSQIHPSIPLQMPPNMNPKVSPAVFPQTILIPHPIMQPYAASVQVIPQSSVTTPPPARQRPPLVGVITSPLPAHPAPQGCNVPPFFVAPVPLNTSSTCSASSLQLAGPLPKNLAVAVPPASNQHVSGSSTLPCQYTLPSKSSPRPPRTAHRPSNPLQNLPKGKGDKVSEVVSSNENGVHLGGAGNIVQGACTGMDGASDCVIKGERRIRKLSQKAKALQEAAKAKIEAKKKVASAPQKRVQTLNTAPSSDQVCTAPIQLVPQTASSLLSSPTIAAPRPAPAEIISLAVTKTETSSLGLFSASVTLPPKLTTDPVTLHDSSVSVVPNISSLAPPPPVLTNQPIVSSTSSLPAPFLSDHDYTIFKQPKVMCCKSDSSPKNPPKVLPKGRKQKRGKEQQRMTSTQDSQCVGGSGDTRGRTGTGLIRKGKKIRKLNQRARALQETIQPEAEAKKRKTSSPGKKHSSTSHPKEKDEQNQQVTQPPGFCLGPSQSMWVMIPGGLVQLPQGSPLALRPCSPLSVPPMKGLTSQPATPPSLLSKPHPTTVSVPINLPGLNQPHPHYALPVSHSKAHPQSFVLQSVPYPSSAIAPSLPPQPPPKLFLPYKGTVRVDPVAPPRLRREALQFDSSLMFLEPQDVVCDWLSGRGGVVVPGLAVALPYLPPFVSSLNTFSVLLQAKKSLTKSSLQLLCQGSEPRHLPSTLEAKSSTKKKLSHPADLPDSTSELKSATDKPAPPVNSDLLPEEGEEEEVEAELVVAVRQLVAERFTENPAYQLLKARFLSCFTVPALLATMQPITEKTVVCQANEEEKEEEEDEEVEMKKIKERGRKRKAERSLLLCERSGTPENHFSEITSTNQTRPDL